MTRFNAKRFLTDQFHTPERVNLLLSSYGLLTPKISAVEKWFQRGRIPGEWSPLLLVVLELEKGKPTSLTSYLEGER